MGDALTELREEGREEGRQESLYKISHNLFKMGMSISDIAKATETDESKVTEWLTDNK